MTPASSRPGHGGEIQRPRLDFSVNLNPLTEGIPDELWLHWKDRIHNYPPATPTDIEHPLAICLDIPPDQLLVTPGGNAALDLILQCIGPGEVIIPTPCFSEYPHQTTQKARSFRLIPRPKSTWFDPASFLDFVIPEQGIVILGNPNNPTGTLIPAELLLQKIQATTTRGVRWIIDEAFIEFTHSPEQNSLLPHLEKHPQVSILGSLTKQWNIPGLRIGYLATADIPLLNQARARQLTWPMNGLVHAWAEHYLKKDNYLQLRERMQIIRRWRTDFQQSLKEQGLLIPYPSGCNFFLAELASELTSTERLYQHLLSQGIHLRRCDNIPGIDSPKLFRLAVRPPQETQHLLTALDSLFPHTAQPRA